MENGNNRNNNNNNNGGKETEAPVSSVRDKAWRRPTEELLHHVKPLTGLYETWFLDYASYVILERAVPYLFDGLKPVQRRILHAMKRLDDGRYNKVANIIGYTMQYHPHGDASIGDALVSLGQKELLIDTQGNWGNILTGDRAAAARYIEARPSKFALDVVFNPKTTEWKLSYDGRNNEPVQLPVKFPLLLAQGAEGIAVGLASKILPHNFVELIDSAIAHLKGETFELVPDFPTGGMADFSRYNDGIQGGKVRVRARISKLDKKTLVITEIPFGKTTTSLIDSIISANDKGKIKIKKIDDNTAENVEIMIHLPSGISSDQSIDGLYAFTDCEMSISPNCCVIENHTPRFIGMTEMLKVSVANTLHLLTRELEIRKEELDDAWHKSSLEKIFIEERIYNLIEKCETWKAIIDTIKEGLKPFIKNLRRIVTEEDIVKLTEIKIKRISRYDAFKAEDYIKSIEAELKEVAHHLAHITQYTIDYYTRIREKYGKGRERKTEIRSFDVIEATKVVVANQKMYVDRKEGFVGTSLKKDEFVGECSDIDDVIVFLKDGRYLINKVSGKSFVGKDILHVAIFKKNDTRTIYNAIYEDGKHGPAYIKRFAVSGVTRDREYNVSRGTPGSKILYFTANPNGEAETVKVSLKPKPRLRKVQFETDFSEIAIKGRGSQGNILSRNEVFRITLKESGVSTLGGRKVWFDTDVMRLNADARGIYLGEFSGDDRIITIEKSGNYNLHSFDLSTHFEPDVVIISKYNPDTVYSAVYFEGEQQFYYVKRFQVEPTDRQVQILGEHPESRLEIISRDKYPRIKITFGGRKKGVAEEVELEEFIAVKGSKARGKRLTTSPVEALTPLESLPEEEPGETIPIQENPIEEAQDLSPQNVNDDGENETMPGNEAEDIDSNGEQRSLFSME